MKKIFIGMFIFVIAWLLGAIASALLLLLRDNCGGEAFLVVPLHNILSITVSCLTLVINTTIALYFAFYLNQQKTDKRNFKAFTEKTLNEFKKYAWQLTEGRVIKKTHTGIFSRCENLRSTFSLVCSETEAEKMLGLIMELDAAFGKASRPGDLIGMATQIDAECNKIIVGLYK